MILPEKISYKAIGIKPVALLEGKIDNTLMNWAESTETVSYTVHGSNKYTPKGSIFKKSGRKYMQFDQYYKNKLTTNKKMN